MNNTVTVVEDFILKIDEQLLILYNAPKQKEYKFYNFGVALKCLIDAIQKHDLSKNPYYRCRIQEYISVYKDLFGDTDLKNNMVSKMQPDSSISVFHIAQPRASKVCELLKGCKIDYLAFASDKCPDPNIFISQYDAKKYPNKEEYYKAHRTAYQHLTDKCWNVGHKFQYPGNGDIIIMTFEQYISSLKAEQATTATIIATNISSRLSEPSIKLFEPYFVADKKEWYDKLIIDIEANLKSGKGGYTIVAMAKVLYNSGKLHATMKPKQFAPWLRAFCQAWGITTVPTCKAGHNGVKGEIIRINNVFYYLSSSIPK